MSSKLKVFIVGATGITGQSIAHGLLAKPEQFV
jgi:N-acetyl-gamma-glutamylphosphate reductase